jgi:hypothetical protein
VGEGALKWQLDVEICSKGPDRTVPLSCGEKVSDAGLEGVIPGEDVELLVHKRLESKC